MINYLSKFNCLSIKLITCQNKLIADQKTIDDYTISVILQLLPSDTDKWFRGTNKLSWYPVLLNFTRQFYIRRLKIYWRFFVPKIINIGHNLLKIFENIISVRFFRHSVEWHIENSNNDKKVILAIITSPKRQCDAE